MTKVTEGSSNHNIQTGKEGAKGATSEVKISRKEHGGSNSRR